MKDNRGLTDVVTPIQRAGPNPREVQPNMNGIENAQHDISDASFSLETAIELLNSIGAETSNTELATLVAELKHLKEDLERSQKQLVSLQGQLEH